MTKLQKERNAFEFATNVAKLARKRGYTNIEFKRFGDSESVGVSFSELVSISMNEINDIIEVSKLDRHDMISCNIGTNLDDRYLVSIKVWYFWGINDD